MMTYGAFGLDMAVTTTGAEPSHAYSVNNKNTRGILGSTSSYPYSVIAEAGDACKYYSTVHHRADALSRLRVSPAVPAHS